MTDDRVNQLIREATRLRYSRRGVVKRAAALGLSGSALSAALAGAGHAAAAPSRAPARQTSGKLAILANSYFVPAGQEHFLAEAQRWGQENGVEVTADFVSYPDLQAKIGAAVSGNNGPDIIEMWDTWPSLYYQSMVEVNDLAAAAADAKGGYFDWVAPTAAVDGQWYSVPTGFSSSAWAYRISHFEEAGVVDAANNFPKTWDEVFAVGKNLKAMGKPIGQAFGHSLGDPPNFCYSYMWAHGAMEVEEDGKTVAFNKPEFVAGMEKFIQGYKDGFDETGLAWDDAVNNRAFLADEISATINGSSIYLTAQKDMAEKPNEAVVDPADITHGAYPAGPAGQFAIVGSRSYGIMKYTKNLEAAKAFMAWWTAPEQFQPWLESQGGYIVAPQTGYADLPIYVGDPKLKPYIDIIAYGRNKGYAGPSDIKAARVYSDYIVVDAFSKAIQSGDAKGSIEQAAQQLDRIYRR